MKNVIRHIRAACRRENLKRRTKGWLRFLFNPRLLLCLLIAWMITNGWSYLFLGLGIVFKINWMQVVGGTYMGLLWLPFTPEKLLTLLIAIGLLRLLFPRDQRTLAVLRTKLAALRCVMRKKAAP